MTPCLICGHPLTPDQIRRGYEACSNRCGRILARLRSGWNRDLGKLSGHRERVAGGRWV